MRFNFATLILLVLLVAAGYFVTAPWWAFRSLRDAARSDDIQAMSQLIDYNAVREGLAAQLSGRPAPDTPPPDVFHDPIGALKHAFTPPPAPPPGTENYITSKSLADMAEGLPPGAPLPAADKEPFPKIAFWGPDRCRITVAAPGDPTKKTEFTFQRKTIFGWKVVRIVLPGHPSENK